ncbi:6-pyruvoyltetrahydropterin/6-carboxytetrahydropterin synthase [Desulfobaculum xiamenense]|uniref:6-carboxy-5,6,7,8-tetrahydropterin synthase n=1 Tax=Desulfobaculum xiamenense TaxID=995050 RepID=A0A846QJQ1_9BACT|nr:6-carboxytetrahydropterin synthase QueD [Desulfobaculum xiamenense]NJB68448.1 6-pyruvoyltetrahydropterin/6-carboxytetrahydropterin synthase [Desulfobaculum xiamenense]
MQKKGKWRLTVRRDFAAAHQLRHYEGKCERMHGHNFNVEAQVEGDTLTPDTELLIDFKVLKTMLGEILGGLDHCHLNELPQFAEHNPSSENLARYIYHELAARLADTGVSVHSVTVSEKPAQSATYFEE